MNRLPNDPTLEADRFRRAKEIATGAPTLMLNSWYDVSIGPNVAMYRVSGEERRQRSSARNNMFMVIAPTTALRDGERRPSTPSWASGTWATRGSTTSAWCRRWFDHFLKGVDNGVTKEPKVRAYMMGLEPVADLRHVAAEGSVEVVTYYLDSDGSANSLLGNGRLTTTKPSEAGSDQFIYDPHAPGPVVRRTDVLLLSGVAADLPGGCVRPVG